MFPGWQKVCLTVILFLGLTSVVGAQVVVEPGGPGQELSATGCDQSAETPVGDCPLACTAECSLADNTAKAQLDVNVDLLRKRVTSTVYADFEVSATDGSVGNTVQGTLSYDVGWKGWWAMSEFILNADPRTTVTLWIKDMTTNSSVKSLVVHTVDNASLGSFMDFSAGGGLDNGAEVGNLDVNLVRGHSYRVLVSLTLEATGTLSSTILMDYLSLDYGARWDDLQISAAPDLSEQIAALGQRIDSLEAENNQLRHDLESHTHTYLTGRGVGHNNTEAQTSSAIIMGDDPVDEGGLDWLSDSDRASEPLPSKSLLLTNYPNPFNPTTTIQYSLPEAGHVSIKLYNTLGQVVRTLVDQAESAGLHQVELNADDLASGVYYYRLTVGDYAETRKMTFLK